MKRLVTFGIPGLSTAICLGIALSATLGGTASAGNQGWTGNIESSDCQTTSTYTASSAIKTRITDWYFYDIMNPKTTTQESKYRKWTGCTYVKNPYYDTNNSTPSTVWCSTWQYRSRFNICIGSRPEAPGSCAADGVDVRVTWELIGGLTTNCVNKLD